LEDVQHLLPTAGRNVAATKHKQALEMMNFQLYFIFVEGYPQKKSDCHRHV
jgi:hypothetical protein